MIDSCREVIQVSGDGRALWFLRRFATTVGGRATYSVGPIDVRFVWLVVTTNVGVQTSDELLAQQSAAASEHTGTDYIYVRLLC